MLQPTEIYQDDNDDYNPDRAQKLISLNMSRHLSTRNIQIHARFFRVILLTDRQTDRQTNEHGQKHIPPPLLEVNRRVAKFFFTSLQLRLTNITPSQERTSNKCSRRRLV